MSVQVDGFLRRIVGMNWVQVDVSVNICEHRRTIFERLGASFSTSGESVREQSKQTPISRRYTLRQNDDDGSVYR